MMMTSTPTKIGNDSFNDMFDGASTPSHLADSPMRAGQHSSSGLGDSPTGSTDDSSIVLPATGDQSPIAAAANPTYVHGLREGSKGTFVDPSKFKTRICRNHHPEMDAPCPFGERCVFAHDGAQLRPVDHSQGSGGFQHAGFAPRMHHHAGFAQPHHEGAGYGGYGRPQFNGVSVARSGMSPPFAVRRFVPFQGPSNGFNNQLGGGHHQQQGAGFHAPLSPTGLDNAPAAIQVAPLSPPMRPAGALRGEQLPTYSDFTASSATSTPKRINRFIHDPYNAATARVNICA